MPESVVTDYLRALAEYVSRQRPTSMPDRLIARPPASVPSELLPGELGVLNGPSGVPSTELTMTVETPRLNHGMPTNIPLLAMGQVGIPDLLAGQPITDQQYERAVSRAMSRGGAPAYATVADALWAAENRKAQRARSLIDSAGGE